MLGDIINAIAGSVGKTQGEGILAIAKAAFPDGHPEILFAEWLIENSGQIRQACDDLGIEPPEPGPKLYQRLRDAVMPVLSENPHMGNDEGE